jgi:hypothetical protein
MESIGTKLSMRRT